MNRLHHHQRAAIGLLALCLLILAAGYGNLRMVNAEQRAELLLLRTRVETQSKQIRESAVYIPFLEESLSRYEHATPAEWRDFARRLQDRRMRENRERAVKAIGAWLRPRYEGSDGSGTEGGR